MHDLRDLPLRQVRATVGVLGDDPHVFASTLRENLRLARPTASDGEIESALGSVALATWYAALPHGLDTWLGDGGLGLSGGERARLGLARLVLSGHPVWVLDEPTAHLDTPLAQRLAEVVLSREGAGAERSVVWITHTTVGLDLVDEVLTLHPLRGHRARREPCHVVRLRHTPAGVGRGSERGVEAHEICAHHGVELRPPRPRACLAPPGVGRRGHGAHPARRSSPQHCQYLPSLRPARL